MSVYRFLRKIPEFIGALSLDVALGAGAGGSLAALLCDVSGAMPLAWWFILPLTVWVIYTTDHLFDAWRIGPEAASYRHRFHYRHFYVLSTLLLVAALLVLYLTLRYLPSALILGGLLPGVGTGAHLLLVQRTGLRRYPAEVVIALLYTLGIWFGPLLVRYGHLMSFAPGQTGEFADFPGLIAAALGLFFLAALANVITLSLFERKIDARESPNTVVLSLGTDRSEFLLYIVLILSVAGTAASLATIRPDGLVAFALILLGATANVPLWVYRKRTRFEERENYRSICDGVFLLYALPALLALCY